MHYFYDEDDNFVLSARLPPEVGALVLKALDAAGDILREESRAQSNSQPNVSAETSGPNAPSRRRTFPGPARCG